MIGRGTIRDGFILGAAAIACACPLAARPPAPATLPHLEHRGSATQLIVDGKPFLLLGGELHNSSSSSAAYMQPIWPKLAAMHLNAVLVPIAWETIEPTEGAFDFTQVDTLLQGARANGLRIVPLWFGSWKNTYSSYVPAWVKRDQQRFPRVQTSDGRGTERLSPFSAAAREADARAFAALMHHLRAVDGDRHTLLFVQVENEVGVIPQSRDHSAAAEAAFAAPVPSALLDYLAAHRAMLDPELRAAWELAGGRSAGSWRQVFGDGALTDHLFMSWSYAAYVERVAAAGKAEYPLPAYANAALIRPNYEPGQYNSGGPLPSSADIWRAAAPAIDFVAPDIYFDEFAHWAAAYARPGNPLFVPEAQGGARGAANALYAYGALAAVGFSPFGIDGDAGAGDAEGNGRGGGGSDPAIANIYRELAALSPLILRAQAEGRSAAVMLEGEPQRAGRVRIGGYIATLARAAPAGGTIDPASRVAALILQTAPDEFLIVGSGDATVTFSADTPGPPSVGIEAIEEELLGPGGFAPGRRLNGDENGQGQVLRLDGGDAARGRVYRVRLYRYS